MNIKRYKISIRGRVQGVGYRYWTRDIAQKLDITGFVKNMPNGDVYIEAEAIKEKLELFVFECKQGPIRARVETLTTMETSIENSQEFIIK